jgi:hypothetical protein
MSKITGWITKSIFKQAGKESAMTFNSSLEGRIDSICRQIIKSGGYYQFADEKQKLEGLLQELKAKVDDPHSSVDISTENGVTKVTVTGRYRVEGVFDETQVPWAKLPKVSNSYVIDDKGVDGVLKSSDTVFKRQEKEVQVKTETTGGFVGTPNQKISNYKLKVIKKFPTKYGEAVRFVDDAGNNIVAFNYVQCDIGDTITADFLVKKHDVYKGEKSTVIDKIKILSNDHAYKKENEREMLQQGFHTLLNNIISDIRQSPSISPEDKQRGEDLFSKALKMNPNEASKLLEDLILIKVSKKNAALRTWVVKNAQNLQELERQIGAPSEAMGNLGSDAVQIDGDFRPIINVKGYGPIDVPITLTNVINSVRQYLNNPERLASNPQLQDWKQTMNYITNVKIGDYGPGEFGHAISKEPHTIYVNWEGMRKIVENAVNQQVDAASQEFGVPPELTDDVITRIKGKVAEQLYRWASATVAHEARHALDFQDVLMNMLSGQKGDLSQASESRAEAEEKRVQNVPVPKF